jgi:hypothetical protein
VKDQYVKLYQEHCELSIDEAMLAFKGRLGLKQYMQDKLTKWGVKLWSLCDNHTGFMMKWNVYTGAGEGTIGDVVKTLLTIIFTVTIFTLLQDCFLIRETGRLVPVEHIEVTGLVIRLPSHQQHMLLRGILACL